MAFFDTEICWFTFPCSLIPTVEVFDLSEKGLENVPENIPPVENFSMSEKDLAPENVPIYEVPSLTAEKVPFCEAEPSLAPEKVSSKESVRKAILRYHEKRERTLQNYWSKKIRYQSRRMSAIVKPRVGGRFVKKTLVETPRLAEA